MTVSWAERLYAARRDREPIPPLSAVEQSLTVEDAYGIQREFTGILLAEGAQLLGYKLGLTSEAMQEMLGVGQPDFGPVLSTMTFKDGASIAVDQLIQPRIEAEIAFEVSTELRGPGLDREDVERAISGARAALEVIDSRIENWEVTLVDTVADLASTAAVITAETLVPVDGWDPRLCGVVVHKNGRLMATGAGAAALGDPIEAVLWLANTLGSLGTRIEAGHIVLTGSLHAAFPFSPGDTITAEFDRLGSVMVQVG
jgi:2-keto-4-pentenoate hydratase